MSKFKVKRPRKGELKQHAQAGNSSMQLQDVYRAVTGEDMQDHHHAGADVDAAVAIALEPSVLSRGVRTLADHGGLYKLAERDETIKKHLQDSKDSVAPPLPEGWVENPLGPPAAELPNLGPESGPTSRASAKKDRVAEYWDLHYDRAFVSKLAKWSRFYGAEQTVKLVSGVPGRRSVFAPCADSDPAARCRYRRRQPDETLAKCKAAFPEITGDHVELACSTSSRCTRRG